MGKTLLDPIALKADLSQFTGTEQWYRHGLNRHMLYTDGVQFFCEKAGCYWFLDIVATELFRLQRQHPFMVITLVADDGEADIVAEDGDGGAIYKRHIHFTDAPDGTWRFYLIDNIVLLPSEY